MCNYCGSLIPKIEYPIPSYSKYDIYHIYASIDKEREKWKDFNDVDSYIITCIVIFYTIFEKNVVQCGKTDLLCKRISNICNRLPVILECKELFVKKWNMLHYIITYCIKSDSEQNVCNISIIDYSEKIDYSAKIGPLFRINYSDIKNKLHYFYDKLSQICLHIGSINKLMYEGKMNKNTSKLKCYDLRKELETLQDEFSSFISDIFIDNIHIPCHERTNLQAHVYRKVVTAHTHKKGTK